MYNVHRPGKRHARILEGIDKNIHGEGNQLAIKYLANIPDILSNRPGLQDKEGQRKATGVKTATADIPDLAKPGPEPAMRPLWKRPGFPAESIREALLVQDLSSLLILDPSSVRLYISPLEP